jgi:hypothetical protein
MVSSGQVTRGIQRVFRQRVAGRNSRAAIARGVVLALVVALPSAASAQVSGDGFMFKRPSGSLTLRGGYELANTSGQPFTILQRETTVGPRSFDAFNAAADLNWFVSPRMDLLMTLDMSTRTKSAEYREWEENGKPITQQSTLDRLGLGAGLRYNLADRGRQISSLAFIPAKTIPYVGATGGVMWYDFVQKGDFVEVDPADPNSANIVADELRSNHYSLMAQAFAGVDRRINARWSLIGEARYTQARSKLTKDYAELGNIELSGLALNIGAAVRF